MVTIQFSTSKGIPSAAIRLFTWSWASHVDLVLPSGDLVGAIPGEGVKIHNTEYYKSQQFTVDAPESVYDFALTQLGKPYDWAGIFGLVTRDRNWENDDKWFCSELAAWSFKQAGCPLLNEVAYRITPRDLLISPLLKQIK
jgi:uncharacterized protein YycO